MTRDPILERLLSEFWSCAITQGREGHDWTRGDWMVANRSEHVLRIAIHSYVEALSAFPGRAEAPP